MGKSGKKINSKSNQTESKRANAHVPANTHAKVVLHENAHAKVVLHEKAHAKVAQREKTTVSDFREAYWQLFCEMPLNKITVSKLCERAGYNRGTFYLHFDALDDVRGAIESDVMEDMLQGVEECLKTVMRGKLFLPRAMAGILQVLKKDEKYIVALLGEERDPEFLECLTERLKPLWRTYVIGENTGRSDAEIDLILDQAITGGLKMIGGWLVDPRGVSSPELAKLVYDMLIRDVSKRAKA